MLKSKLKDQKEKMATAGNDVYSSAGIQSTMSTLVLSTNGLNS